MKHFAGEAAGTFILVGIGCAAVAIDLSVGLHLAIVASIWGVAVVLAIIATRKWCAAHFNPAVTLGFYIAGRFPLKRIPVYLAGQFTGALLAAAVVFFIFDQPLWAVESKLNLVRGDQGSVLTARAFGEFYPNLVESLSMQGAVLVEFFGTFALVMSILWITTVTSHKFVVPVLIGIILFSIIYFAAPFTQAGLNPARDLSPRIFSYFAGWGEHVFTFNGAGWAVVYILAPLLGGSASGVLSRRLFT